MSFLVDTDVLIDNLRGLTDVDDWLQQHLREQLAISIITLGELYKGAYRQADPSTHLARLTPFLARFGVINLTDSVMHRYGHEYAALRRQGNVVPDLDLLIAATALTYDFTLATRNARHFERIPGLKVEVVELTS